MFLHFVDPDSNPNLILGLKITHVLTQYDHYLVICMYGLFLIIQ
jgi:hypothetical protein